MMYYYYDINSKDLFDELYKDTYVYSRPTKYKNGYYVLKLDFSGIGGSNKNIKEMESEFAGKVIDGIRKFNSYYNFNIEYSRESSANRLISDFFTGFYELKLENKIYILIDEYDNFTNAILEGDAKTFKDLVGKDGLVKNFYSAIKENMGTIVDRIFITGICPITLDSMTTGFNIATNISLDIDFTSMIGLTHDEVKTLIREIEPNQDKQVEIFDLMLKNYDGYLFNKNLDDSSRVFNGTLVMYFLKEYVRYKKKPDELIDPNLAFNYGEIGDLIRLQNNNYYKDILKDILDNGKIVGELKLKFNLEERFKKDDIVSLLYYFGYLTIDKLFLGSSYVFRVPNYVMMNLYGNYFLELLDSNNINIDTTKLQYALLEMYNEGRIDKLNNMVSEILSYTDNRLFINFDEKYIQLLYFTLLLNNEDIYVYTAQANSYGYSDLFVRQATDVCKYNFLIELKYIKKENYSEKELNNKRNEALKQIEKYVHDKRLGSNLKKYIIIYIGDELKVSEEV